LFESRWPVISGVNPITLELEEHRKGVCDISVVIHDKNARRALLLQFVSRAKRWDAHGFSFRIPLDRRSDMNGEGKAS
jgi:hypothetical protein